MSTFLMRGSDTMSMPVFVPVPVRTCSTREGTVQNKVSNRVKTSGDSYTPPEVKAISANSRTESGASYMVCGECETLMNGSHSPRMA